MKRVLHVGCGPSRIADRHPYFRPPEWAEVRLDIDPRCKPDIVASITDMAAVPAGSFDAVFSSHNLEHLYAHDAMTALQEFRRVLGPGGFALIVTPDLKSIAEAIVSSGAETPVYDSPAGRITPVDMLYGHRGAVAVGNEFMAHRYGFTNETLFRWLLRAGFRSAGTARKNTREVWGVGFVRLLTDAEIDAERSLLFL